MKVKRLFDYAIQLGLMAFFKVISPFVRARNPKYRNLWLISERGNDAGDNGYWFYRYLKENQPKINCAYVITKDSPDYDKVSKLGGVIHYRSFENYIIFFAVSKVPVLSGALGGKGVVSPIEYLQLMLYNQNPYSFHLWYLNTLFLLSVFIFLIDRFSGENNARILKFALLIIIPAIASTVAQPWHLVTKGFVYQLPYFIIGTLIKRDTFEKSCHKWIIVGVLSAVLLAVHTILESSYDFSTIGNVAVFYIENILAVLVTFGIISASYAFSGRLSFVEKIGRNSMVYYLYHQPFCCAFLGVLLYDKLRFPVILVIVICMIVSLVVPYFISKIAKKTGLHKVLGWFGLPS